MNYSPLMKMKKFTYQPKKETTMILAAIRELGLTQNEVAQAVHKCKSYISMILREQRVSDPIMIDIKSFLAVKILKQGDRNCNR